METRRVCIWWSEMGYQEHMQLFAPATPARSLAWPSHFPLESRLPHGLPAKDAPSQARRPARRTPSASSCGAAASFSSPGPDWPSGRRFPKGTPFIDRSRGSSASIPHEARQRPLPPSGCPCARLPFAVLPGGRTCPFLPAPSLSPSRVPTWRPCQSPGPASYGLLPAPPLLPGGYSLKPLRISLARSSLADMMRRLPPAALPRWLGGASQTVTRNRGQSRSTRTPQASSGSGQTRTGLSLPLAPAPDPFSFPLVVQLPP